MDYKLRSHSKAAKKELANKSKLRSIRRNAHKFVNFCQGLKDLIPTRKDTALLKAIKILGIADKIFPENKTDTFKELGFTKHNNVQFIAMVSSLDLMERFERDSEDWDEHYSLGFYTHDDIGSLILFEDENRKFASDFFCSADFQFKAMAKLGWDECKGCMEVEKQRAGGYYDGYVFVYSAFTKHTGRQFGSSSKMLEDFIARNAKYMDAGISRTYMFVGPPGVGKTTLAQRFAVTAFERILKMSADTLYEISAANLSNMIDMLDPQCMLIDEIDKNSYKMDWANSSTGTSLLGLIEHLKLKYPHITMVFTANRTKYMHPAMLRPGRTDDIIEFENPDLEDRKAIIKGYADEFGVEIDDDGLLKMAECTEGLAGAWLKELVLKLRYEDAVHLASAIEKMKKYAQEPKDEKNNNQDNANQNNTVTVASATPQIMIQPQKAEEKVAEQPAQTGIELTSSSAQNALAKARLMPRYYPPSTELDKWRKIFEETQHEVHRSNGGILVRSWCGDGVCGQVTAS